MSKEQNPNFCEACGERPKYFRCDWCNAHVCKLCNGRHNCQNEINDIRQFAEELKTLGMSDPEIPKPKFERQTNINLEPVQVVSQYIADEAKLVETYYLKHNKELADHNAKLESELKEMRVKFEGLESTYNSEIKSIGQAVSESHEVKMKELVATYESREAQYRDHIAKLEEHIKKLNDNIEALQKSAAQKKSTMPRAARFQ